MNPVMAAIQAAQMQMCMPYMMNYGPVPIPFPMQMAPQFNSSTYDEEEDYSAKEDDEEQRTLFCGNLDEHVTDDILYEIFLQAGPIESVRIPKDGGGRQRNFGFVTYFHLSAVPFALDLFQGLELFQKKVTIKAQAADRPQQRQSNDFSVPSVSSRMRNPFANDVAKGDHGAARHARHTLHDAKPYDRSPKHMNNDARRRSDSAVLDRNRPRTNPFLQNSSGGNRRSEQRNNHHHGQRKLYLRRQLTDSVEQQPTNSTFCLHGKEGRRTISMQNQDLVEYLESCGICQVCQLRYLKARGTEYRDMSKTFQRLNVEHSDEQPLKKPRLGVCPTCLGLFSEDFQRQLVEGILAKDISKYDSDGIVLALCLPMTLQLRQLSMWFALRRKFGCVIDDTNAPDVPIKEAVKLILNPIICAQLKKKNDPNGLMINVDLRHSVEAGEVEKLAKLHKAAFPGKQKRIEISRGLLEKQYQPARIKADLFEEYLPIPPTAVDEQLQLKSIVLTGPLVCVAGRYRKLSRELSHTPWVLHGQRMMEDSIEELIIHSVAPHFSESQEKIIFMSSGREDVDVRCLGKGRPFALEIPDAMCSTLSRQLALQMEQAVDRSGKVSVRNLQVVPREELLHIKTGEEQKRKFYRALCTMKEPVTVDILQKLQISESFVIQQKTPIRVLHRRPLLTRPRTIYSLKARVQRGQPNVLIIDLVTQAGMYIKELVHGEFGRTTPSLASIIGKPIDIQALDVVGIDLDWPAEVDNAIAVEGEAIVESTVNSK
ncbi:putative tRNA pseudouridine synthase Pus10 [Scaptodrosophila lebanonensis]|uniref:tRNA pseudouridine(55) synthase n=1 Tax=Drosophila lebanonensis TaxID=7225 RepID=A0A6J2U7B3_DROLE|nr:putative tRNA pseudouridine synthase Pus10 [Scaptodrosophila lebanonensis]